MIVRRVEALGRFLDTEDGRNLLAGYRRAANILRIEEKKDGRAYAGAPDLALIDAQGQAEEKALAVALDQARGEAESARARRRISRAPCGRSRGCARRSTRSSTGSRSTRRIRTCVRTACKLLNALREATRSVADFSRIEG